MERIITDFAGIYKFIPREGLIFLITLLGFGKMSFPSSSITLDQASGLLLPSASVYSNLPKDILSCSEGISIWSVLSVSELLTAAKERSNLSPSGILAAATLNWSTPVWGTSRV